MANTLAALLLCPMGSLRCLAADKAAPLTTFGKLPIKEITVFKDGHAFVAHEGQMPVNELGDVVMDYLPTPVVGTFWPYSAEKRVRLVSVLASQKRALVERTALSVRELLEANVGAEVTILESGTNYYDATILGLPARSAEELAASAPPHSAERLPEKGALILLKTAQGVKAAAIDRILEVTFKSAPKPVLANEEFRNLLTLKLDWNGSNPAKSTPVGLFYLQRGIRWIPSYKIEVDGKRNATVKLQATLINELADLDNISVNLVVGVPSFAFKDMIDPIALQQNLAHLSGYFQPESGRRGSLLAQRFSNAIMSQAVSPDERLAAEGASLGPEIGDSGKTEDLFVFNLQRVTLKRGERVALQVAEFTLPYQDVFTLELPFGPPPELRGNVSTEQQREMARLLNAPKVMHKIRIVNQSKYPFTTAPALILRDRTVLAQGMMTYTSTGASVDLSITTAVDFQVKKTESETKRTPNAAQGDGMAFFRIDLAGKVTVTSHRPQPIDLEVTRYVLGVADQADNNGKVEKLNVFENGEYLTGDYPFWWNWYGWPSWWSYFNGIGRITWKVKLEPKQALNLAYDWHYFWR